MKSEHLPPDFDASARQFFMPLAERIGDLRSRSSHPLVIAINGAQGSGKSTLAAFLKRVIEAGCGLSVAVLSIDDFYLTRTERRGLAQSIHPLFETRGVPGTHDISLCSDVMDRLMTAGPGAITLIPRFDKAVDDRAPETEWERFSGPADIIIFEGWCVGAQSQPVAALDPPVNRLEAEEDPDGIWRAYVNEQLEHAYPALFGRMDYLIMLKAPDFECVYRWRRLQEEKLKDRVGGVSAEAAAAIMDARSLERFIMHYERLTRHMLAEMPARADAVLELDPDHQVFRASGKLWEGWQ